MLGIREPEIYGSVTYPALCETVTAYCAEKGIEAECLQSNHEGTLVDMIQGAYRKADGIVINPGAYTHTSVALLDALKAVGVPAVEVHISDPDQREAFRRISFIRPACVATVKGRGVRGYLDAVDLLLEHLRHES